MGETLTTRLTRDELSLREDNVAEQVYIYSPRNEEKGRRDIRPEVTLHSMKYK